MKILDLLKGAKPSPDIRADIAALETRRADLDATVDTLRARRAELLLQDGGDVELDRVDAELAKAYREIDRADLAAGELSRRLAAAEEAERAGALDAAHARALHHQAEECKIWLAYIKQAERLRELMFEVHHHHRERNAANAVLRDAGDSRTVDAAEATMTVRADGGWGGVLGAVRLPDPRDNSHPIYPVPMADTYAHAEAARERIAARR